MSKIDLFANQLLEEAKHFFEKAQIDTDAAAQDAHLHAALMLSLCALEAHVNALGEEFSVAQGLSAQEKGILLERDVRLEDGRFQLKNNLRIARLEERIEFLHAKFSGNPVDHASDWWRQLGAAIELRNRLTHAKEVPQIGKTGVRNAIQAVVDSLDALYRGIYKRAFPPASLGLHSELEF